MLATDPWLWATFVVIGLCTLLPRSSFIVAGSRIRLPAHLQRALRYAPAAALAALIVPDVLVAGGSLQPANPKLLAALAVIATVSVSRNQWLPFLVGMAALSLGKLL